jgi:hypothetical protein
LQDASAQDVRVGLSIGFVTKDWDWEGEVRTIKEIELWEISLTPFPANPKAFVEGVKGLRNVEKYLREVEHFPRGEAKRLTNIFAALQSSPSETLADLSTQQLRIIRGITGD